MRADHRYGEGKASPDGISSAMLSREFVASFMIFDQLGGKDAGLFYAINGYIFGNLPGLDDEARQTKCQVALTGNGNEMDLHSPHWHGKLVTDRHNEHRCDRVASGQHEGGRHARRQSRHLDVPLPRGRSHGIGHDGDLYHLRAAQSILSRQVFLGDFWNTTGKFTLAVKNATNKRIKSLTLTSEHFFSSAGFAPSI